MAQTLFKLLDISAVYEFKLLCVLVDSNTLYGSFGYACQLIRLNQTGNYMIAIAFMSKITSPRVPRLEDYVHPLVEKHVSGKYIDFISILTFC